MAALEIAKCKSFKKTIMCKKKRIEVDFSILYIIKVNSINHVLL